MLKKKPARSGGREHDMSAGIPFVPLDCQLDEKFEYIEAEFGLQGFAIVVKLFQRIYGGHGYYCEWNDRVALLFAKRENADGNVVREIVSAAVKERIFDEGMYKKYGILTSKGIQKRFLGVAKRRKEIFDKPEYVLISAAYFSETADNSGGNVNNSPRNADIPDTSKASKETKLNGSKGSAAPAPQNEDIRSSLLDRYGYSAVEDYERRFNNWRAKHTSVSAEKYETIKRWMEQDSVPDKLQSGDAADEIMGQIIAQYQNL